MIQKTESQSYFSHFDSRRPPNFRGSSDYEHLWWSALAGMALGFGFLYIHWRWTNSLNPDHLLFSISVAGAETMMYLGCLLFTFDIWSEKRNNHRKDQTAKATSFHSGQSIDIFITTFDESLAIVKRTIEAARAVEPPEKAIVSISLLDDGDREIMRQLAKECGIGYITRTTNEGFKAGNLRNGLLQTYGDFIVICDADTCLFPTFLTQTMPHFDDPKVGWVQTPHWFYDIPEKSEHVGEPFTRKSIISYAGNIDDPFMSQSSVFFDIIQRRRDRNRASFCCGAASIHRREALLKTAVKSAQLSKSRNQKVAKRNDRITPFEYHVSEDFLTSLKMHADGWDSVYHPKVEAKMLSPWSSDAWTAQRIKYAGGTIHIMIFHFWKYAFKLDWRKRLHYVATFWSYLATLWIPVLLFAPVFSLVTGASPVQAYSTEFFLKIAPFLILNELALIATSKGHDISSGRVQSVALIFVNLRAFINVICGRRPNFRPTPKNPEETTDLAQAKPLLVLLVVFIIAAIFGVHSHLSGFHSNGLAFTIVNLFWLGLNASAVIRAIRAYFWSPQRTLDALHHRESVLS